MRLDLRRLGRAGFTLMELLITATVLMILASAVVPMARNGIQRQKEIELRRALREMRTAIDDYKVAVDQQKIKPPPSEAMGYPPTLEELVEGVPMTGRLTGRMRFLRRVPVDPLTGRAEWGLRSVNDEPTSATWGGGSVFDVYSQAHGSGMNGKAYRDW